MKFLQWFLLLLSSVTFAQNVTINALPSATTPFAGTETIPLYQSGSCSLYSGTCNTTLSALATYVESSIISGWTQNVNANGSTLTGFTSISGTWTQSSGYIRSNNPSNSGNGDQWALQWNTQVPIANSITEVVLNVTAWNQANNTSRIGLAIEASYTGSPGQNTSVNIILRWATATTATLEWVQPFTSDSGPSGAFTFNTGMDYTLRVVKAGGHADVYLGGVLLASLVSNGFQNILEAMGDGKLFIGLFNAGANVGFKNLKQWTPAQP